MLVSRTAKSAVFFGDPGGFVDGSTGGLGGHTGPCSSTGARNSHSGYSSAARPAVAAVKGKGRGYCVGRHVNGVPRACQCMQDPNTASQHESASVPFTFVKSAF